MPKKSFTEAIAFNGKIDRENGIIRRIALITSVSKNNRKYTDKALESVKTLGDGTKSFLDHEIGIGTQSVKNLLGEIKSTHKEGSTVYGDLYILKSSPGRDLVFEIAEMMPHLAGFSISGTGKFSEPDDKGIETVEDVVSLQSIDFVGHPATTSSVWEQYHNNQQEPMTYEEEEKLKEQFWNDFKKKTHNF
jgi:hypothetical protein